MDTISYALRNAVNTENCKSILKKIHKIFLRHLLEANREASRIRIYS